MILLCLLFGLFFTPPGWYILGLLAVVMTIGGKDADKVSRR